ncbi:hypothetical protein [Bradyrhizobium sp. CCBAU 51765]|uniref:hypothetical protein n=1 Tax=unclassified Bradyrhizobium TaxID=2631580 RepID=UPI0018877239|nr:hypothetical protein [Bradyrhizobium sp. CCBAU 51765]
MLRFLVEILFWSLPDIIAWRLARALDGAQSAEHTFNAPRKTGFNDPVYKKNLQRLIERNRQFEETKE